MQRRELLRWTALAAAASAALLAGGCASINQWSAEVATFGDWPVTRTPGSYAFEYLPSQQAQTPAQAEPMRQLEAAAAAALAQAGFRPVAAGAQPDVLVQVGARVSRSDPSPWDDPLWWPGGFGPWRYGPWRGAYWGHPFGNPLRWETPRYEREVALLLRDRASGKPLYEARASSESFQRNAAPVLQPLFAAAMAAFPLVDSNPHRVTVPLNPP